MTPDIRPKPFEFSSDLVELSDEFVARQVAALASSWVQYDPLRNRTFLWNGVYWEPATDTHHQTVTRDYLTRYRTACEQQYIDEHHENPTTAAVSARLKADPADFPALRVKHSWTYKRAGAIMAIHRLTKSDPALLADPAQWDADPYILGVPNGIVDLRTGELMEPRQDAYITKVCAVPYDPAASFPEWDEVLADIFEGDPETIDYVQDLFGYASLGFIEEAVFPFFLGTIGRNGKDTIAEAVQHALGTYAKSAPPGLLTQARYERHRQEILEMDGVRLYVHSELPKNADLHDSRVKEFTGREKLTGEIKGGREVEFKNGTLHLTTCNDLPKYDLNDQAIAARVAVVPFTKRFHHPDDPVPGEPVADVMLKARLKEDAAAQRVLAWVVAGAVHYLDRGHLKKPPSIAAATQAYREGNFRPGDRDGLISWLNDNAERDQRAETDIQDLFTDYENYSKTTNVAEPVPSLAEFGKRLSQYGIPGRNRRTVQGQKITLVKGLAFKSLTTNAIRTIHAAAAGGNR